MYKLREIERRDVIEINRWRNDPELMDTLGGGYRFINSDVDNEWYERYLKARSNNVRCAIVDENDEIIGCVFLLNIDNINHSAELHIMIGNKKNQNKGIGTFAVSSMVNHAFYNLNLCRLQLEVLDYNTAAQHLYKKIGFKEEGRKRKAVFKNGKYVDEIIMGLLREEYEKVNT